MSFVAGGRATEKALNDIKLLIESLPIFANGTAVEGVCVTRRNPPVDCPGCEHGVVPVGRRVWRGICKVGCGWFCDRGI